MIKKLSVVLIMILLCTMVIGCSKTTNDKTYQRCCRAHSTCGMCKKGVNNNG